MSRSNRYCSVPQCYSWEKRSSNINFHAFPQTGDKYRVWVEGKLGSKVLMDRQKAWQLKLKIGKPVTKYMKVCSLHFIDDDYFYRDFNSKQRKFLKKTAVPSRNLPVGSIIPKKQHECSGSRSERLRQESINKEKSTSHDEIEAVQGQTIDCKTMSEQCTRNKTVYNCNCCVLSCTSRKGKNRALHFHTFPKQGASKVYVTNAFGKLEKVDRRKAWEDKLLLGKPVTKSMLVCSLHFQASDYLTAGSALQHMKAPKLKATAVPSKNLPKREYVKKADRAAIAEENLKLEKQSALRDQPIIPQSTAEAIEHHDYCLPESTSLSEEKIPKRNPEYSFHTFPKAGKSRVIIKSELGIKQLVDRREVWINNLKIKKKMSEHMRVCSLHFTESDYFPSNGNRQRRVLKLNSVPTMKLPPEPDCVAEPSSRDTGLAVTNSWKSETLIFKTPVKRARTSVTPLEIQQPILESCTDPLAISEEEIESSAFGNLVATKHGKLNKIQKMHAEILITKILHKAALNELTEDTSIVDTKSRVGNNS